MVFCTGVGPSSGGIGRGVGEAVAATGLGLVTILEAMLGITNLLFLVCGLVLKYPSNNYLSTLFS
jgi:hypothetical protein